VGLLRYLPERILIRDIPRSVRVRPYALRTSVTLLTFHPMARPSSIAQLFIQWHPKTLHFNSICASVLRLYEPASIPFSPLPLLYICTPHISTTINANNESHTHPPLISIFSAYRAIRWEFWSTARCADMSRPPQVSTAHRARPRRSAGDVRPAPDPAAPAVLGWESQTPLLESVSARALWGRTAS